jgi:hypothetical protein
LFFYLFSRYDYLNRNSNLVLRALRLQTISNKSKPSKTSDLNIPTLRTGVSKLHAVTWIANGAMGEAVAIVVAMAMDGAMVINAAVAINGGMAFDGGMAMVEPWRTMESWVKPQQSLQPWQWMEPWLSMWLWQSMEA